MSIKRFFIVVFLCSLCSATLFANDWVLTENESGVTLTNVEGKVCDVISDLSITSEMIDRIGTSLTTLWSIPGLHGTQSRVKIESERYFHFILYPDSLTYKNVDLKQYMPSGLSFKYDSALFYDVTLKVDDFLPRVSGAYINPTDFLDQLYSVSIMPELNLHGDVLLQRIARLETALMALSKKTAFTKPSEVSEDIVFAVITLHKQNPAIKASDAVKILKEQGIKASKKDVDAVFMVYLGIFE